MAKKNKDADGVSTAGSATDEQNMTPDLPTSAPLPPPRRVRGDVWRERLRAAPFLGLIGYYLALIALVALLTYLVPAVQRAFFTPVVLPAAAGAEALFTGAEPANLPLDDRVDLVQQALDRSVTTLLVILGALALVVPVAWVYMRTKRLQYDPALVSSVVILPIVVAGIAMVVKNSIALAFALAGIVAAVRFRNTLKDPRDAVYIFLVIGIGLASGVQALDVALVMSMLFNFVVLFVWRFNIGSIYGGWYGRTGVLSTGDAGMLVAQVPETRKRIRRSLLEEAEDMKTDGILLVHADQVEMARHTVQEALSEMAKDWRLVRVAPRDHGLSTLEYLVRLKKKATPPELVGALDERWSAQVKAAEFIPFRTRSSERSSDP